MFCIGDNNFPYMTFLLENPPKAHQNGGRCVGCFGLFLSLKIAVILLENVLKNL